MRSWEGSFLLRKARRGNQGSVTNALQEVRLIRLELNQPPQHIEHVEQLAGIFGQPVIGLDLAERRGWATVALPHLIAGTVQAYYFALELRFDEVTRSITASTKASSALSSRVSHSHSVMTLQPSASSFTL